VVDTAFLMQPLPPSQEGFWPRQAGAGVLALNISALIVEANRARSGADSIAEAAAFVRRVLAQTGLSVLLLPHVVPLGGGAFNNDALVNAELMAALADADGERLGVVPASLNAPQLKQVVSRCRYLIAARTHATIAGFSSGVPTVSIAYSVKARGINLDLFGHERFVLETPHLNQHSLWDSLLRLQEEEPATKAHYAQQLPAWREQAMTGARRLASLLQGV
jgi:colanic acid/amylovoran biosynthesis protein